MRSKNATRGFDGKRNTKVAIVSALTTPFLVLAMKGVHANGIFGE
jgi:hypothetical protein